MLLVSIAAVVFTERAKQAASVPPGPQLATAPEADDLPCDDGPYVLDLCDCGEGLGSSFNHHKTALTYATALHAKYIDLPLMRGAAIDSAKPRVREAMMPPDEATSLPPQKASQDIFDGHDGKYYSPFFGLGSSRCNAASLKALRASATGNLTFVDAVQQEIEPTDRQSRVSNINWLCARLESEEPLSTIFGTDPTLSRASSQLGGHSPGHLRKLVLVLEYKFVHPDLGFCAISPEFRERWRKVQRLEARPRSLKETPTPQRVIAVHFRWGDTATDDVNNPNRIGQRTAPLSVLAQVANAVRQKIGGRDVRVLLFTEEEYPRRGRSHSEVVAEFSAFTNAVPNTELRLGDEDGNTTALDLIDMAQADVLIGGMSGYFELAAHLCECVVFTSQPGDSGWATAASPAHWAMGWGEQPSVTKKASKWGAHVQMVGFSSVGSELVFDGAWWDAHS